MAGSERRYYCLLCALHVAIEIDVPLRVSFAGTSNMTLVAQGERRLDASS